MTPTRLLAVGLAVLAPAAASGGERTPPGWAIGLGASRVERVAQLTATAGPRTRLSLVASDTLAGQEGLPTYGVRLAFMHAGPRVCLVVQAGVATEQQNPGQREAELQGLLLARLGRLLALGVQARAGVDLDDGRDDEEVWDVPFRVGAGPIAQLDVGSVQVVTQLSAGSAAGPLGWRGEVSAVAMLARAW